MSSFIAKCPCRPDPDREPPEGWTGEKLFAFKFCRYFEDLNPVLINAARDGDVAMVEALLAHGASTAYLRYDESRVEEWGLSPLTAAVASDSLECVKLLVAAGADVNECLSDWRGPALNHVRSAQMVEWLLAQGADINYSIWERKNQQTALHTAIFNRREEVVAALVANGADLDIRNYDGLTPLEFAEEGAQGRWGIEPAACLGVLEILKASTPDPPSPAR